MDVIVADDVQVNVLDELKSVCASLAGTDLQDAVIVADGNEAGDILFGSLLRISVPGSASPKSAISSQVAAILSKADSG